MTETIYIPLLDEGADVWRPTLGDRLPDGSHLVHATPDYDAEDEHWAFKPGSRVICEPRTLAVGHGRRPALTAVRLAPAARPATIAPKGR